MERIKIRALGRRVAIVLILASAGLSDLALGGEHARVTAGSLLIEKPWSRATPGGANVGVGYVTITNTGAAPDALIGGTTSIAGGVEFHETRETDGVMRMRALPDGLTIKPGETVTLAPGGAHIMFTGLKQRLKPGEPFKATLQFRSAGPVDVEFQVAPIGAAAAP